MVLSLDLETIKYQENGIVPEKGQREIEEA